MSKNKYMWLAGIVLGALLLWHGAPEALAAALDPPANNAIQGFVQILAILLAIVHFIVFLALYLISYLINPYLLATTLEPGGTLNFIWTISRDITNSILAFTLVAAALYAIVLPDRASNVVQRETITKFIIAVIVVNFSWWFPRVILDIANVLTASVFSIPSAYFDTNCTPDPDKPPCPKYIANIWVFPQQNKAPPQCISGEDLGPGADTDIFQPIEGVICIQLADLTKENVKPTTIMSGFYVNHLRVMDVSKISANLNTAATGGFDSVKAYIRFAISLALAFLYVWGIGIPLVGMAIIFFVRLAIIWLTVAFMPFMFVGYVIGSRPSSLDTMKIFHKFVSAAFVPVLVAIPLVIGQIMILSITSNPCRPTAELPGLCEPMGTLFAGIQSFWDLLWIMLALAVMWLGFFAATRQDEVFGRIGGTLQGIGKTWMGIPAHTLPIVPMYDRGTGTVKLKAMADIPLLSNLSARFNQLRGGGAPPPAPVTPPQPDFNRMKVELARLTRSLDNNTKSNAHDFYRNQLKPQLIQRGFSDANARHEEVRRIIVEQDPSITGTKIDEILQEIKQIDPIT